jgi:hypothetical protein
VKIEGYLSYTHMREIKWRVEQPLSFSVNILNKVGLGGDLSSGGSCKSHIQES